MASGEASKLWGGRFKDATDPVMEKFNSSLANDKVMYKEDIQGSMAYSHALEKAGLLTKEEGEDIRKGLGTILNEWNEGSFLEKPGDEDIHTANERRLKELVGEPGGKIHTGRSRNDQVALDMRLWLMNHLKKVESFVLLLLRTIVEKAEAEQETLTVGYTHLQRAQPVRWSHWLLSFGCWLCEDLRRLQGVYRSADMMPLGSGAIAGTPFNIDRNQLAQSLGFSRSSQNSMMAVADRDFIVEYLYWCTLTSSHLSRLAEDLSLYCSSEFGFVTLSERYSTGSSLMPQKKNPDSLELIRGKAASLIGKLTGFLCVLKGLPSTYNKDLQEDKGAMFSAASTIVDLLQVATGVVATLKVNRDKCMKGLSEDMLATDVAYYLVRKGMPFRTAHGKAGEVVRLSEEKKCPFSELLLQDLKTISELFTEDVSSIWQFDNSVEQYKSIGGTSKEALQQQVSYVRGVLNTFSLTK